jgi:aminoglycoside phosphotransferase (APT) family kinase protein
MERRRGIVVRHDEPPALAGRPDTRRRVSHALVDTLADLHAIDLTANGLSNLGKPAGFVERQVRGWDGTLAPIRKPARCPRWMHSPTGLRDSSAPRSDLAGHRPRRLQAG